MDSILFIAVIVCLGLVVVWYVANERAGSKGEKGLLGVAPDRREIETPSYQEKKRALRWPRLVSGRSEPAERAFKVRRGGFRQKSEDGYKTKGPLPRFTDRPTGRPEPKD